MNYKIGNAAEHKAAGVIFVNDRSFALETDDLMPFNYTSRSGVTAEFPVIHVTRRVLDQMLRGSGETTLKELETAIDTDLKPQSREITGWRAAVKTEVERLNIAAKNVVGVLEGSGPLKDETVIIGAHYDHLGRGETGSLARGDARKLVHYGADDNGSGTTTVLELARRFGGMEGRQGRRMVFMLFSGEERGLLGSRHYANKEPLYPLDKTAVMINLDMVGRLRDGSLELGGTGTAKGFDKLVDQLNEKYQFKLKKTAGGMGPSDHAAFYPKEVPVFFFFTGLHNQYHRPTDKPDTVNYDGMAKIADMVEELAGHFLTSPKPEYVKVSGGVRPGGRPRVASIRFTPGEYDEEAKTGLPVAAVTEGGPAEKGGMKAGDVIIAVDSKPVTNIGTYMTAMGGKRRGKELTITVKRGEEKIDLKVTPE